MTKEEFIGKPSNWGSHRHLLWMALEATKHFGLPVLELGCGDNSTPFLRRYCEDNNLELLSYDYDRDWAKKFNAFHVKHWDLQVDWGRQYGVVLIDESPGEHRKQSLMEANSQITIIHDSEPIGWNASDYQVRELFKWFKFTKDYQAPKPDAWTTALSNTIDVSKWDLSQ